MSMNKIEFVKQLRATAEELKPLTHASPSGAATWNGEKYIKCEEKKPDPFALAWWSTLVAVAELIEAQEDSLSDKQVVFLDRLLFGGTGSLNDLYFDSKTLGSTADSINKGLEVRRHALFESFK